MTVMNAASILSTIKLLVGPLYIALTSAALLSLISPTLTSLSSHGKTRAIENLRHDGHTGAERHVGHGYGYENREGHDADDAGSNGRKKKSNCINLQHNQDANKGLRQQLLRCLNDFLVEMKSWTVNKSRFSDFYITGIFATLFLLWNEFDFNFHHVYKSIVLKGGLNGAKSLFVGGKGHEWLPTALLLVHLIRRFSECKWIQTSGQQSRMHIAGYLLGAVHYLCLPFIFVQLPVKYGLNPNVEHSVQNCEEKVGATKTNNMCLHFSVNNEEIHLSVVGLIAAVSTFGCMYFQYQQYRHHVLLAALRAKKCAAIDGRSTYQIPYGGWFQYLSCPHYFAEIMIYSFFAVLLELRKLRVVQQYTSCASNEAMIREHSSLLSHVPLLNRFGQRFAMSLSIVYDQNHWIVWLWVIVNLSVSAWRSHEWYLSHFGEKYPKHRRRLVPFVW